MTETNEGNKEIARGSDCGVCGSATESFGTKRGNWRPKVYRFRKCLFCAFIYVENPCVDFENLYSAKYYAGQGADSFVDYINELVPPKTIRYEEWAGIAKIIGTVKRLDSNLRWLDYGCGTGGLVRYLRSGNLADAEGYDQADIPGARDSSSIPIVGDEHLRDRAGYYDVITAIEVFEHLVDPAATIRQLSSLLRPGGILFYTTGNCSKFQKNFLTSWRYVIPEIHISYFQPETMTKIFSNVGLKPVRIKWNSGFEKIICFKTLKTLGVRYCHPIFGIIPWFILARFIDRRYGISAYPIGVRDVGEPNGP